MKEKIYEEVGNNYRFFLGWRHAAFAGYIIVLGAVMSISVSAYKDAREIMWLIPLLSSPIGALLWVIDVRTRSLYHAANRAGKELEGDTPGFYAKLIDEGVALSPGSSVFSRMTQSSALNILFLGSSVALLLVSWWFYVRWGS